MLSMNKAFQLCIQKTFNCITLWYSYFYFTKRFENFYQCPILSRNLFCKVYLAFNLYKICQNEHYLFPDQTACCVLPMPWLDHWGLLLAHTFQGHFS